MNADNATVLLVLILLIGTMIVMIVIVIRMLLILNSTTLAVLVTIMKLRTQIDNDHKTKLLALTSRIIIINNALHHNKHHR